MGSNKKKGGTLEEFSAQGIQTSAVVELPFAGGSREVICLRSGDRLLFEGDIVVHPILPLAETFHNDNIVFGHGVNDEGHLWANGVVPFAVHAAIRDLVMAAIQYWESLTPFRFEPRKGHQHYAVFVPNGENWSSIGCQKTGRQEVGISPKASILRVVHEIGHLLGLWHEHSRRDRNQHVHVIKDHIKPGYGFQFESFVNNALLLGSYDFDSIMHYPQFAFSIQPDVKPTMVRKDGAPLGPRTGLSKGDLWSCRKLYPTIGWD